MYSSYFVLFARFFYKTYFASSGKMSKKLQSVSSEPGKDTNGYYKKMSAAQNTQHTDKIKAQ